MGRGVTGRGVSPYHGFDHPTCSRTGRRGSHADDQSRAGGKPNVPAARRQRGVEGELGN